MTMIVKDVYKEQFRVGVACEKINGQFTNHEIGNPAKEELMKKHFSSMTFANELKPAYNMGFAAEEATEEYLPFVINPQAKAMLDWARENGMPVRGHVLVWHSQCPKEVFCKGYEPVTIPTDPELLKERPMLKFFEKLDPVCFVDRQTMLKRLRSYIFSLMEYMYREGYARTIYAWDVVNEAIEPADKTEFGLRNSYWFQVIGDDFIYYAFRYAKDAVEEMSKKYAASYGVDAQNTEERKIICPKLVYNDYNEWQPEKKAFIIGALQRETPEHGSIIGEGLIDCIGMQGHLSDNNNIDEYIAALKEYAALVEEVHITELDVKCTCLNKNQEYYQAVFYKDFFSALLKAKEEGANLTSVTFWGLTDDNSWIKGANPLLFRGDLTEKKAYDGVVFVMTGEDLGEPEKIELNLSDRVYDFETPEGAEAVKPEELGFKMRGFGEIEIQDRVVYSGKAALANEKRFGDWCGISFDVSDFIGQTIAVRARVKSPALAVTLGMDGVAQEWASVDTTSGNWELLEGTFRIPNDVHSMLMNFGTKETEQGKSSAIYVDDVEVKLIGLSESFEDKTNIAAIRGAGHLPFCYVTDQDSVDGLGHSYCVTRQEKDATIKLNISPYIGMTVAISMYVKSKDKTVTIGLDGAVPQPYTTVETVPGEWVQVCAQAKLPEDLTSAEIFVETEGNGEFLVDEVFVRPVR